MARQSMSRIRIYAITIVSISMVLPIISQSISATPPAITLAISCQLVENPSNWTITVMTKNGVSTNLKDVYLAAWTGNGSLYLPPKALDKFNSSGNLDYRHVIYSHLSSTGDLSAGDYFIFNKTAYAPGSKVFLLSIWNSTAWNIAFSSTFDEHNSTTYHYDPLPNPPAQPKSDNYSIVIPVGIAIILVSASVFALFLLRKKKR
jgi:hypothetical protein